MPEKKTNTKFIHFVFLTAILCRDLALRMCFHVSGVTTALSLPAQSLNLLTEHFPWTPPCPHSCCCCACAAFCWVSAARSVGAPDGWLPGPS